MEGNIMEGACKTHLLHIDSDGATWILIEPYPHNMRYDLPEEDEMSDYPSNIFWVPIDNVIINAAAWMEQNMKAINWPKPSLPKPKKRRK
jgi:hypothetical protein